MQAKKLMKAGVTEEHCKLRCLEVLYLWNSLSTCKHSDLETMLEGTSVPFLVTWRLTVLKHHVQQFL